MFTRNSVVAVRPFTRQSDGEEIVIGSLETGVFLAVPPEAVELLDQLASGKSVREVSDFYQEATGVFLFTRTDLYFVAAAFLNCKNLLNDTSTYLRNQLARIIPQIHSVDQSAIPPLERRAIRTYAGFFLAGRVWAFLTLFWITIPVTVSYWGNLVASFRVGYAANPTDFLDALAATTYFLLPTVAGLSLIHI